MRYTVFVLAFLLVACPKEKVTVDDSATIERTDVAENTMVYADRKVRQCESDGMSLQDSAQILINAGLDVLGSTCGIRTGVEYVAVCGGATADILVHEIREVNLPDAEPLGYLDIRRLVDAAAGTGYQLVDCAERFTSG